jgi:hypothetical protein
MAPTQSDTVARLEKSSSFEQLAHGTAIACQCSGEATHPVATFVLIARKRNWSRRRLGFGIIECSIVMPAILSFLR